MNIALIVAAGNGTRLGSEIPKQYILVNNKPILMYTIEKFDSVPSIDQIVVVVAEKYIKQVQSYISLYNIKKTFKVVKGGPTRRDSVRNGLNSLNASKDDIVLIHDGARPLVSKEIIEENIETAHLYDGCVTCVKSTDTSIKSCDGIEIESYLNRETLFHAQTPQSFKYAVIKEAYDNYINETATDDSSLAFKLNKKIHIINGSNLNFKITTAEDLKLFSSLVKD